MFLEKPESHRYVRLAYIGVAFLIALLYDRFVWDASLGFGFLLYIVASIALFSLCIFKTKKGRQQWAILFTIPAIVMAGDVALLNNTLVTHGVPVFVLVLCLFFAVLYPLENPGKERFLIRAIPSFRSIDLPFVQWAQMYRDVFRWNADAKKDVARKILIGVSLAVPLVIVFGLLFAAADEVFRDWVIRVLNIDWVDVWRLFRTVVLTLLFGGLFYVVIRPDHIVTHKEVVPRQLDTVIVGIILFLMNTLFGIFVFFQLRYLFGGASFVLENGLTYAEYARKGFFQLCWVIVLAAVMLFIIYRSFVFHKRSWAVTVLQTLLIGQVGVIAASALKRMNLYQEAYGFTVLRLYVEWFLYYVLAALGFAGVSLIVRIPFRTFFYATALAGISALTIVSSANVDRVIAKENVERFVHNDKTIDLAYVKTLSVDSIPALEAFADTETFEKLSVDQRLEVLEILTETEERLAERTSWKELNVGAWRTAHSVRTITSRLHEEFRGLRLSHKNFQQQ